MTKCLCCAAVGSAWQDEGAIAVYTTLVGNAIPLCSTCLSMWLRNAAVEFELAPRKIEFLGA